MTENTVQDTGDEKMVMMTKKTQSSTILECSNFVYIGFASCCLESHSRFSVAYKNSKESTTMLAAL